LAEGLKKKGEEEKGCDRSLFEEKQLTAEKAPFLAGKRPKKFNVTEEPIQDEIKQQNITNGN
jgi:hypothetical protein